MKRRAWSFFGLAAASLAGAHAASADDLRATTAIDSVLVFPYRADITRIGEVAIPEGDHNVIVRGLPRWLDPGSVRVRFGDAAIVVGAVTATEAFPEGGGPEQAQALRDQLQDLEDQMQTVDDRIATAQLQIQFLQSQAGAKASESDGDAIDPEDWAAALAAIETGASQARSTILAARQTRRALEREAEELRLELDSWDDDLALRTDVAVALTAESAVTAPMVLEYQVAQAGWGALYEARLDSEAASLTLDRKINVYQNSGEDWTGVSLAVSTAPASGQLTAPEVYTQNLTLSPPPPPAPPPAPMGGARRDRMEEMDGDRITVTGSRIPRDDFAANSPIVFAAESQSLGIESVAADFASTYSVAGRVDVASDGEPRTFSIGQEDVDVDLVIRTAPRTSLDAFLTAKLTYEGEGPLPQGALRLYRDGAYLRESYLSTLIPEEEIELGFGVDESVLVTWVDESEGTSDAGLMGRNTQISEDHRFEALNRHATPFTVEIIDRRPIPQDDDIVVRVSQESTPPDETDYEDRPGVVAWRAELQPGETLEVRNAFSITYPTSERLVGR